MRKYAAWLMAAVLVGVAGREASAQRRVTGRVTSTGGEPLASASVNVQGTTLGTYTSDDGRFTITVPDGPQALVARRIGYKRAVVPISATATEVTITLERDVLQLERQIVTGTATTVAAANAANAVATVTGDELTRAPVTTLESGLQGKIPGAIITQNSGAPGGGLQVQLRGITSINASASPLYVVDGVIVSNAQTRTGLNSVTNAGGGITASQDQPANRIADINPEDIESIEVLKGASAGAIYGSKASNGVIIITTKRGASGTPQYNFTQRLGTFQLSHKLGLRCFHSEAEALGWWRDVMTGDPNATLPVPFQPTCNDFEDQFYSPTGGPSYETNLSVRGGNTATQYYVGGTAKRDNAIQRETYYQKQAITANLSQLLGSHVTLRANNQFIHSLTDRGISGNDNNPIVSPGDIFSATPTWVNLAGRVNGQYIPNLFLSDLANPFQNAQLVKNPEDVYRYIGSLNTTISAYSSNRQTLDFTVLGGIDAFSFHSRLFSPPEAYFEPADGLPGTLVVDKTTSTYANLNLSGAHKWIDPRFTATTSFGTRREYRDQDAIWNQGLYLPADVQNLALAGQQHLTEDRFRVIDNAFYVQEELLTLGERLLLTAAVNAERSTVNGDANKYYTYPKYSASYRLPWLPPFVDELKLRTAWGRAGNQPPFGYAFNELITSVYDGTIGARPSAIVGNPNIKPETSTELEGGFDAQFANGKAGLNFTLYQKNVTDLILAAAVAPSLGYGTRYINGGALKNTGTEIAFTMNPIQNSRFSWNSNTTFANVNSSVTQLDVPCYNGGAYFSLRYGAPWICKGYSIGAVQVYNGYDSTFVNGVYKSRTRHISTFESMPDFTMGFANDFTFGPFRLSSLFDWRKGGKAVNLTNLYFDATDLLADTVTSQARLGRFSKGYGVYLEDAGFVKLRELTLSYAVPNSVTNLLFRGATHDVRLELSGRNLKTWTKYTGYDPEVSNFGSQQIGRFQDVTPYPPSRSIFVSVNANF